MKNKFLCIIIFLAFIITLFEIYNYLNQKNIENEKIDIISIDISNTSTKFNYDISKNYLTTSYLGYVEIPRLKIKKLIKEGTTDEILNTNVVGLHKFSFDIDEKYGNIILAGHNNKYVFGNLYKIKIGDEINLTSHKNIYRFKVIKKDIVKEDDFSYFKVYKDKKVITLITCYKKSKRLIVIGELYEHN